MERDDYVRMGKENGRICDSYWEKVDSTFSIVITTRNQALVCTETEAETETYHFKMFEITDKGKDAGTDYLIWPSRLAHTQQAISAGSTKEASAVDIRKHWLILIYTLMMMIGAVKIVWGKDQAMG
ncbi:hypothetical protein HDU97_004561, partial [Phlyctochytrium planicorne]